MPVGGSTGCKGVAPAGEEESKESADDPEEPVGPIAEEQLAELIAALPDSSDIAPENEAQVENENYLMVLCTMADKMGDDYYGNEKN